MSKIVIKAVGASAEHVDFGGGAGTITFTPIFAAQNLPRTPNADPAIQDTPTDPGVTGTWQGGGTPTTIICQLS